MQTRRFLALGTFFGLLLLATLLSACGSDAELGRVCLASGVDDQGRPVTETASFQPGDTVYLSVELKSTYEGLKSTATWKRSEEILATQTVAATRAADSLDPLFVVFRLDTQRNWPTGTYRCELFVPDQGTTTLEFVLK